MKKVHIFQLILGALAQAATQFAVANPQYAGQAHLAASVDMSLLLALGLISGSAVLTPPAAGDTVVLNPAPPAPKS